MTVTIYHNPRCSKSRQALALLEEAGVQPEVVAYLDRPLSAVQLDQILTMLSLNPRDLMRRREKEYIEHKLDDPELSRAALIDAMVRNPILIERPIVVNNDRAAIGRPPENVLTIL